MSEFIDGIEGNWEPRTDMVVQSGEHFRFGGRWTDHDGEGLDFTRVFKPSDAVLDEDDYLEVFVPNKPVPLLPIEEGVYADRDGDLWRLYEDQWEYLSGGDITDVKSYAPLRLIAPLWNNLEDEDY